MESTTRELPPLTLDEAAVAMDVSIMWLRRRVHSGEIAYIRKGLRYFIPVTEIERVNREGCK